MTLLAWCQGEANREQRHALDKRWIPSEREGGNREKRQRAHLKCLSKFLWKKREEKKKATAKSEFFTTAYKYITETLKDIIRHFHSPCLLCTGWGGKLKGSKHICISESLVPREPLWAVSANLFSALLTAHQQQPVPPPQQALHLSTLLMPGQIYFNSLLTDVVGFEAGKSASFFFVCCF